MKNKPPIAQKTACSGQAVIFILMALVVLIVAFLWNVDLHMLVTGKTKAQNAGDAAALAAAKWQGNTLNLIGELNIMHAVALDAKDDTAVDAITNMQARLCFTGPLTALVASQAAARKNGAQTRGDFTDLLKEHAADVAGYGAQVAQGEIFPEPYPGAWQEYYASIISIANDGIAAAPDNAVFFGDVTSGHILLDKAFYEAVAGVNWCWFFLNYATGGPSSTRTILDDFTSYEYFGSIPPPNPPLYRNSEFFSIGMGVRHAAISQIGGLEEMLKAIFESSSLRPLSTNVFTIADNWYVYDKKMWSDYWPGMTYGDEDFLPLAGSVREEYNYTGADAVTRLYIGTKLLATKATDGDLKEMAWTAAAKPFGYLVNPSDSNRIRPNALGMVLPAFRDIRLIPMDSATSGSDGSFDIGWRTHTDEHLPIYTESGTKAEDCKYCRLIERFEDPDFRKKGSEWLLKNSHLCTLPSPSGGGHGGGTRRGH